MLHRMRRCGGNIRVALRPPPKKVNKQENAQVSESSAFRGIFSINLQERSKVFESGADPEQSCGNALKTCACERPTPARSPGGPAGDASACRTLTG